ncbi:Ornithine aminotransferase [Streptomyces tendae]
MVELLETGEFQHRAAELGVVLRDGLADLVGKGVVGFRARGLWAGVDIDPAIGTGREVSKLLMQEGILVKDTHGSTIRLAPPLTITAEELGSALGVLERCAEALTHQGARGTARTAPTVPHPPPTAPPSPVGALPPHRVKM